jgi:hypothetical protein
MHDRPTTLELIAAVRQHLEKELIPTLTDARLRFQTLVAANVLAIAEREGAREEEQLQEEWKWLGDLIDLPGAAPHRLSELRQRVHEANQRLCQAIRTGDFDEEPDWLLLSRVLRRIVERKLEIANPRYLASFRAEATAQPPTD